MIYLYVVICLLVLIYKYDIQGRQRDRDTYYNIILVILTVIAGMRYRLGVDTTAYSHSFYHEIPELWNLTSEKLSILSEPLWVLLNSIVRSLGGRWFVVQFIQAAFVNCLVFRFFKKHSDYIFTCVFFYFIWMYAIYTMEEMRASISVAICLYAYDYFLDKKWIKGYALMLLGCLFHRSTIALLITPVIIPLLNYNIICVIVLIATFVATYIIKSELGEYVELLGIAGEFERVGEKVASYATSDQYGEQSHNINYMIIKIFPFLLYPLLSLYYCRNSEKKVSILKPLLMFGIMTVVARINIEIFFRYTHFFACYIIIYISELFTGPIKTKKTIVFKNHINSSAVTSIKICVLFIPLFFTIGMDRKNSYVEFYPYTSIIVRYIDLDRETFYSNIGGYPRARLNEY